MKCIKCGHENRTGAKHCSECGGSLELPANVLCPSCGHKNRKGAAFCDECGANIKEEVKQSGLPREKSTKTGLPLWFKIVFGAIVIISLIAFALIWLGKSLKDNYVKDLEEKVEKCAAGLTSMQALAADAEIDETLLLDSEWIAENNTALGVMEEHCTELGWDNDVPEEYETVNDLLLQSDSEYSEFIRLYRVGISEVDGEIITQAAVHLIRSDDIFTQVIEEFDEMGIGFLE